MYLRNWDNENRMYLSEVAHRRENAPFPFTNIDLMLTLMQSCLTGNPVFGFKHHWIYSILCHNRKNFLNEVFLTCVCVRMHACVKDFWDSNERHRYFLSNTSGLGGLSNQTAEGVRWRQHWTQSESESHIFSSLLWILSYITEQNVKSILWHKMSAVTEKYLPLGFFDNFFHSFQ